MPELAPGMHHGVGLVFRCKSLCMRWIVGLVCVVLLGACADEDESASSPSALKLNDDGNTVLVDGAWQACETIADCVQVGTSCD